MSRTVLRRLLVALLATGALACGIGAVRAGSEPDRTPTAAPLGTPLWSPRRVPQPLVEGIAAQRLQSALDAELGTSQSCAVVADENGDTTIAAHAPDTVLIPASANKVFTAVAALDVLGADFTFETKAIAPAPVDDGTIERLWLVGGGDPVLATQQYAAELAQEPFYAGTDLATTPLEGLADAIATAGVRSIPGGIDGDDSRYETVRYLPSWPDSYRTGGSIGPIGALTVNDGFSALNPTPQPVADPAELAASELARLLRERGVDVGASIGRSQAPGDGTLVASIRSRPLSDIVGEMLRSSDALTAEILLREVGARAADDGTTAAGARVVLETLRNQGVDVDGVAVVDGSGLDRGDRTTCRAILDALDLGLRPEFSAIDAGLSVAGESGTLRARLLGTPLEGRLRAKTGTLNGVTALTGIIELSRTVRFAFVRNGTFGEAEALALRDQIALLIAAYPDAPPGDDLVPAPAGP